jgi:hypothetical protein
MQGVRVLQQLVPYQRAQVRVTVDASDSRWEIVTENVKRLSIAVNGAVGPHSDVVLVVDGFMINVAALLPSISSTNSGEKGAGDATLCVDDGRSASTFTRGQWSVCDAGAGERGPASYGPMRQVVEREFLIVYVSLPSVLY